MKSIRQKLWISIIGVTVISIILLWFFQVSLLEQTYLVGKKNEILESTKSVVSLVNKNGLTEEAFEALKNLSYQKNYCIQVYSRISERGATIVPAGSNNIFEDKKFAKYKPSIIGNLMISGEEYYLEDRLYSSYGVRFYVGATHQQTATSDYIVLVASTLAPVKEAVSTIKIQLIYLSIYLILSFSVFAFFLARWLTRPILQISQAAKDLSKGEMDVRVSVKSKDEIGRLADDFNVMASEISKVNQLQREIIANVSHDFRTPLTMIKGYAETIKDLTGDNKEIREQQLDIIIEESDRLNRMANDILDLSKLQSGQLELQYRAFDLSQKLRDIRKRYDLLVEKEHYIMTIEMPERVLVFADEIKIEQVIYNMVNNAVNHTGKDKKVTIVLEELEDKAIVKIIDTGHGIKNEDLPLIWDRYYKPYKKDDRKGMGTGLGLSIVKAILVAHGLNFGVQSVIDQGSTFWFEINKEEQQEQPDSE